MSPDAMSVTTVKDELLNVPKLEPDGKNWIMFKTRLMYALEDRQQEVSGHLLGNVVKPAKEAPVEEQTEWQKVENKARNLLVQRLGDSMLRKVLHKKTVHDMWKAITTKFESKLHLCSWTCEANFRPFIALTTATFALTWTRWATCGRNYPPLA